MVVFIVFLPQFLILIWSSIFSCGSCPSSEVELSPNIDQDNFLSMPQPKFEFCPWELAPPSLGVSACLTVHQGGGRPNLPALTCLVWPHNLNITCEDKHLLSFTNQNVQIVNAPHINLWRWYCAPFRTILVSVISYLHYTPSILLYILHITMAIL